MKSFSLLLLLIITVWCISFTFLWFERFLTVFFSQWMYLVKPQLRYNHSTPFLIKSTRKQTAYSLKFALEKAHLMIFLVVHLSPWYLQLLFMQLLIETVCLRLTNPVFIWLEGISWDFDTSPDFLSNCSFYGLVIDLLTVLQTEHRFEIHKRD